MAFALKNGVWLRNYTRLLKDTSGRCLKHYNSSYRAKRVLSVAHSEETMRQYIYCVSSESNGLTNGHKIKRKARMRKYAFAY